MIFRCFQVTGVGYNGDGEVTCFDVPVKAQSYPNVAAVVEVNFHLNLIHLAIHRFAVGRPRFIPFVESF